MSNEIFILIVSISFILIYAFAFRVLPGEKWQFMAVIPVSKEHKTGHWQGTNLTFYGFFTATAYSLSILTVLLLLGSINYSICSIIIINLVLLSVAMPAAKLVARIVENKKNTITIGGASFIGLVFLPWIIKLTQYYTAEEMNHGETVLPFIAAITIAYAIGEGFGRLACLSFGCCYGKPVETGSDSKNFFSRFAINFYGPTKKISYASGMEGHPVFPIQAMTSILYTVLAVGGIYLFLNNHFILALMVNLVGTQLWRFVSEFFRADYRGRRSISVYQLMSLALIPYYVFIVFFFKQNIVLFPDLSKGFALIWHPEAIIIIQLLWLGLFLYTGKSSVTDAHIIFNVKKDSI